MTPFVIDANVMNLFQHERVAGEAGVAQAAIEAILASTFIALDDDGHCEAEWLECAGGHPPLALKDWIADMYVREKLRLFPYSCNSMFDELRRLGIPKKDHKWVRLARSVPSDAIVTNDIDLFDPTQKKRCTADAKERIKQRRLGPVPKYLRKKYAIDVICPAHVEEYIDASAA